MNATRAGAAAARPLPLRTEASMSPEKSQSRRAAVRTAIILGVIAAGVYVGFILANL